MRRQQRGFTLIEALVVVGIIGVVAVVGITILTNLISSYKQPEDQQTLLQHAQYAGYQMPRDIQMSSNVTVGASSGFPVSINIPVDQNPANDYQVDYLISDDTLNRRQYTSSGNLSTETIVAQYIDVEYTSFESTADGYYRLTLKLTKDKETVIVCYEALRRLVVQ